MPNSEPNTLEVSEYAYGSRQKRIENFNALVKFLETWKNSTEDPPLEKAQAVAERFCNLNFQYGYVSRNDICQQALMKCGLI
jgi:Fe-S cluster assembly ATPase SufC